MAQEALNGLPSGEAKTATFSAVRPHIFFSDGRAADAISFYKEAFGAQEVNRTFHPKRKGEQEHALIRFAELQISGFLFSVGDQVDGSMVATGFTFCLETDSVQAATDQAIKAGAARDTKPFEGEDEVCCGGQYSGRLKDPYGNFWIIHSAEKTKCAKVDG